ncbi:F-box protein SKIP19-like [Senna tora]|uniref:F-box protein SKIP19-like n=1 Tax=Senna tora TaxID=362788 RepID=A0A835CH54_9FABA|nr:F-box protein SKIP19-like [Senna tora]
MSPIPLSDYENPQIRNWLDLPRDVTSTILLKLGAIEILRSAQRVCTLWRRICKDPLMWRAIDMHNSVDLYSMEHDLEIMCRHAIDRSCGQLVDINVENFGTDDLLKYISNCTSHLRRLRLVSCSSISDQGLTEVAQKFPLLEELDISIGYLSKGPLEAIGRSCPGLKSLKFNKVAFRYPHIESDEEAFAIAETMPELRHLQLFGNKLTNSGLIAILNSCTHLESLDLRRCFNVDLEGNLGKRCDEQIKDLRRPNDPTNDYPFTDEEHDYGSFDEDYPLGIADLDFLLDVDYDYYIGDVDYDHYIDDADDDAPEPFYD